jgi:hypothetical protein
MPSRNSLSKRERELRSSLHALIDRADLLIHGSAVNTPRRCGTPTCRCQTSDQHKHPSVYLGQSRGGKTRNVHIPRDLVARVEEGIDNYKKAIELLEELNLESRQRLDQAKAERKAAKKKQAAARTVGKKK